MKIAECFIIALILNNVHANDKRISDKRLCGDPNCSHPVSLAKTTLLYYGDHARLISFRKNVDVTVYSKSAGSRPDLWGIEVKGKRGYAPKAFIREYRILKHPLTYVVDTEEVETNKSSKETKNLTDTTPSISGSVDINKNVISSKESETEDIRRKTPSLEEHTAYRDASISSFPGNGVSAEPLESKTIPKPEDVTQPFEVIDGTTISYDTDGSQSETKVPIHQTVTPASPELSVKHDHPSTISPDGSVSTDSSEVTNTDESSGHIYQYISSWISEGSGNVKETEANSKEKEDDDDETEEYDEYEDGEEDDDDDDETEDDVETGIKGKANEGSGYKEVSENTTEEELDRITKEKSEDASSKEELDATTTEGSEDASRKEGLGATTKEKSEDATSKEVLDTVSKEELVATSKEESEDAGPKEELVTTSREESEDASSKEELEASIKKESEDAATEGELDETTKEESQFGQEVNKEKDFEGNRIESGSIADLIHTRTKKEINIEAMEMFEKREEDSLVKDQLSDSGDDKNNEVSENSPNEARTESVNTIEVIPGENLKTDDTDSGTLTADLNEEISFSPRKDEVEMSSIVVQKIPEIVEVKQTGTPLVTSNNDSISAQINDVREPEKSDNILVPVDDNVKHENEMQNSFFKVESDDDSLENKSVHSEFLQLVSDNESKSEVPAKESQADIESIFETVTSSSESGEVLSSVEDFTEPTGVTDEFKVPMYEPAVEMTTAASNDVSHDKTMVGNEEDGILVEQISAQSPGGYFPWVADVFTSLFGSESSNVNVPDDTNGSEVEDTTEDVFKADDSEENTRKREAELTSFMETSDEDAGSESTASGSCKQACDEVTGDDPSYMYTTKSSIVQESEDDGLAMDSQKSFDTIVCLIITGATVIIFSLGYFYLEKKRRDGSLVAKINELEKALLVSSKECLILQDDLQATKERLSSFEISSVDSNETATSLNFEIEKFKLENAELKEQMAYQEKELENATEAGLELNRMLSDLLSAHNSSETMMKSVEHLQEQLDSQQNTITSLTKSLNAKTLENESLQGDLTSALEKINVLKDDVEKVNEHLTSVLSDKLKVEEEIKEKNRSVDMQLNEVNAKKNAELSELHKEIADLQETINEQKDNLVTKENEVLVLQDCLKHLQSVDDGVGDDKLDALLDVGHIKAQLKLLTIERDTLAEKFQGEEDARKLLEDHMKIVNEELTRLRENYEEADKEKTEAQTRLEVLSNYFKEKETQLQKELGLQEAICLQKEGNATSSYEQIKSLHDEIENYRSQNDTLKKEILDQERSLKCQIATLEKKAHENWVTARQAERKLEETKQEASQLRNRLTIVEKNVTNNSLNCEPTKMNDRLTGDSNGELPTSPVHLGISLEDPSSSPQLFQHHDGLPTILPGPMIPPNPFMGLPPPGVFMPPPPPPPPSAAPQSPGIPYMPPPLPLFPDRRPPPLGRMSSPPPRGTFSPYDDCSPPPSPLPIRYRSPPPHGNEPSDRFRQHRSPPPPSHFKTYSSPAWDDSHGPTRSGFRPLPPSEHRSSPREPKGPALSSGHSSDSLEKSSRHSGRV